MHRLTTRERLLLTLSNTPGLGERGLGNLLESGIPLARLFELPAEELRARFGLTARAAQSLAGGVAQRQSQLAPLERLVCQFGIRVLARGDADYPRALLAGDATDAPAVIYAYGNPELLALPTVALLSSSGESRAGLESTAALAGAAAREGRCVVAGHNRPGYRAAVAAAKAAGGPRLLVLDRGLLDAFGEDLDRDLFPTARVWGYAFEPERTLVLSPFALRARFAGVNNRRRDRWVALLAHEIIAVEVRAEGVMERECRAARARGTPVRVHAAPPLPEGNRRLLADGFPPLAR